MEGLYCLSKRGDEKSHTDEMLVWGSSCPCPLVAVCGTEEFTHVLSALALPERPTAVIL